MSVPIEKAQKYLQRFEGNKPLVIYPHGFYPSKCNPDLVETDINLRRGLYQIQNIEPNKTYKIIAGFKRAKLEDFIHFDWLYGGDGVPDLFNKRLVEKILQICPNDFIALPVTLINLSAQVEPYENKDFYVVNALNTIDAIDRKKSIIDVYPSGRERVEKRVYKESLWHDHLLVFEINIKGMIWHPRLAKALYPSKQFDFLTPEEDSYFIQWQIPEGYNKKSWFEWLNVMKKMMYPSKRLLKSVGFKND
ncbi:hypothetical protein [Rickettsia endosymbiont of Aspidapion aeneum]|uniref:hypothetical protein n=1 Tax=Rickettsia endosymbiont of Aspidapion aeneum TaxID=3066247 RepID=UPI00313E4E1E